MDMNMTDLQYGLFATLVYMYIHGLGTFMTLYYNIT